MFYNRARLKSLRCVFPSVLLLLFFFCFVLFCFFSFFLFPDSRAESSISLCNVLLFLSTTHWCNTFYQTFLSNRVDWDILVYLLFLQKWLSCDSSPYVTSHIRNSIFFSIKWCFPFTDEIWKKSHKGGEDSITPTHVHICPSVYEKSHTSKNKEYWNIHSIL